MDFSLFKKSPQGQEQMSTLGAYNLWNGLRARYISKETYQLYRNFVHDRDFDLLLDQHIEHFQEQIKVMENLAEKFKMQVPSKPPQSIKISAHLDVITDKLIFRRVFSDLISELYLLSHALTTTPTHDKLRSHFIDFIEVHLKDYQNLYKYGKTKGWTDISPSFKTHKPIEKEELSASEAGHIWELLNIRYDQLQITRFFLGFVHDGDFKQILKRGVSTLNKQIKKLVKQAEKYEVQLPEQPPASQQSNIDPEILEDKFAFRIIFKGLQDAINMHLKAVVETIRNDKLRDFFFNLYKNEVKFYDRLVKYGNMKGWTYIIPMYRRG